MEKFPDILLKQWELQMVKPVKVSSLLLFVWYVFPSFITCECDFRIYYNDNGINKLMCDLVTTIFVWVCALIFLLTFLQNICICLKCWWLLLWLIRHGHEGTVNPSSMSSKRWIVHFIEVISDNMTSYSVHFRSEREISAIDVWLSKGLSGGQGEVQFKGCNPESKKGG